MLTPPRHHTREFLDTPGCYPGELPRLLREIRRANGRYGGIRLVLRYLEEFLPQIARRPVTLLDVGTGSADIPRAVAEWTRREGCAMRITAIDLSAEILALAGQDVAAYPEISLVRADALRLPFLDRSIDVVVSSLTLHHLSLEQGAHLLGETGRVARAAFVLNDLVRSWSAYAGAWLDTRLIGRSRLARHDGPLSVLRSFTVPELRRMVALSGLRGVELQRHPLFRVALVRRPQRRTA